MKLIKTRTQPPTAGLPSSYREWWDIGDGYEIYVSVGQKVCSLGVDASDKKDITLEIAKYLGVDTTLENIKFCAKSDGSELYLSSGIDCVVLNYTKPNKYKDLLKKIELIVNDHFKHR